MRQVSRAAAWTIVLGAALSLPGIGLAQEVTIAVVDVETLTLASDEGKVAGEKFKKKLDEVTGIMEKARKDIEDKETRLKTQDRIMSATAKAQLTREIDQAKVEFDRKNQDYQQQMAALQDELLVPVSDRARVALGAYIKEKGYGMVVDLSAENGNVVWANPGNDITLDVVKIMNEDFKKAGGVAPAPAPTPTAARPASGGTAAPTASPRPPATPPASTTPAK